MPSIRVLVPTLLAVVLAACMDGPTTSPLGVEGTVHAQLSHAPGPPAPTFTSIDFPAAVSTAARGINDRGTIIGDYFDGARRRGFLRFRDGTFETFEFPGAAVTLGRRINNRGDLVGEYRAVGEATFHAFRAIRGVIFDSFDVPGAVFSRALGIDTQGRITVGDYVDAGLVRHGFAYDGETFTTIDPPGSSSTLAYQINGRGVVVGHFFSGGSHGFVHDLRTGAYDTIDFPGAAGTSARGINDGGAIVGTYGPGVHGYVLLHGEFRTVDFPGAVNTVARGINNLGDIVGFYQDTDGNTHGFLSRGWK